MFGTRFLNCQDYGTWSGSRFAEPTLQNCAPFGAKATPSNTAKRARQAQAALRFEARGPRKHQMPLGQHGVAAHDQRKLSKLSAQYGTIFNKRDSPRRH